MDNGGGILITPSSPYLTIDVAPSLNIDYLKMEQVTFTNSYITNLGSWTGAQLKLYTGAPATNSCWIGVKSLKLALHSDGNFKWRPQHTEVMN